ncbi:hypothetical protein GSI_00392 [Ganoderma sinense ZZ0214-1]|uniref:Uncharacterized protein n=1 Tax=Ganoderma sinense ZZ0214-1 TaxID=1077348 RepID=A0A2G8SSL8_9APHY|nr:hypothetical protein GSI_00392 [Ganoderma sinense ZZ0214-1]
MDGDDRTANDATGTPPMEDALSSFFSGILAPGSSLNPTFLLALDGVLATLLLVLLGLFVATNYNFHLLFLSVIELCLWASIKWFLSELQQVRAQEAAQNHSDGHTNKTGSKPKDE